ncbi:hypothetical protein AUP68_00576 [Ilyonectria robusta]
MLSDRLTSYFRSTGKDRSAAYRGLIGRTGRRKFLTALLSVNQQLEDPLIRKKVEAMIRKRNQGNQAPASSPEVRGTAFAGAIIPSHSSPDPSPVADGSPDPSPNPDCLTERATL